MRLKFIAGLACALSMVAVAASANTSLGWYVAADVGAHDMAKQKLVIHDVTLVSSSGEGESSSSSSANAKAAPHTNAVISESDIENGVYGLDTRSNGAAFLRAGNQLTPHWRAELELGMRQGKIRNGITSDLGYNEGDGETSSTGRGKLDMTSVMANVLYDIAPDSRLHPFVGAGLGAVQVKADYTGSYADPSYSYSYSIHAKRTVGAYQLIGGLAWALSDHASLDLTYRYLETRSFSYGVQVDTSYYDGYSCEDYECGKAAPKAKVGPATNASILVEETYDANLRGKIRDHSLTIGLRWAFGAPPPAVATVEPTYAEPAVPAADYSAPGPVVAPISAPARRDFTVYFPFDSSMITADGKAVMAQAAQQSASQPGAPVTVVGHADTSGSGAYNVKLSQKRARMVADGLIQLGVPASAVTTDWKGEADPAVPTGDGVKNAENRRATITVGQ